MVHTEPQFLVLLLLIVQTACGMLSGKYQYSDLVHLPEEKKNGRMFVDPKWSPV